MVESAMDGRPAWRLCAVDVLTLACPRVVVLLGLSSSLCFRRCVVVIVAAVVVIVIVFIAVALIVVVAVSIVGRHCRICHRRRSSHRRHLPLLRADVQLCVCMANACMSACVSQLSRTACWESRVLFFSVFSFVCVCVCVCVCSRRPPLLQLLTWKTAILLSSSHTRIRQEAETVRRHNNTASVTTWYTMRVCVFTVSVCSMLWRWSLAQPSCEEPDLPRLEPGMPWPGRGQLALGEEQLSYRGDPVLWGGRDAAGPLTQEQLAQYEQNGFVVVPNVLDAETTLAAKQAAIDVAERTLRDATSTDAVDLANELATTLVLEPHSNNTVKSIFRAHLAAAPLHDAMLHPFVVSAAEQILNDTVYVHHSRVNFQQAFSGKGFNWHSDVETWHFEDGMPRMRALTAVVMLDDNLPVNGALMVLPGSHRYFVGVGARTPDRNWEVSLREQTVGSPSVASIAELASRTAVPVHCAGEAGSVLIFECNLMHGSHNNMSPLSRTNAFTVFNAVSNRLTDPFDGTPPRPDHLANRGAVDGWDSVEGRSRSTAS